MLENLSDQIRDCLQHAEDCARRAAAQTDPGLREDFLRLVKSWLELARSIEFGEQLNTFVNYTTKPDPKLGRVDNIDRWSERLVNQVKQVSVASPLAGKSEFVALPNTIERIIKESSEGIEENLLPTYFKRAKEQLDELIRQGDPPQPLSHASSLLSRCAKLPPPRQ
jgi:hypothetical protein